MLDLIILARSRNTSPVLIKLFNKMEPAILWGEIKRRRGTSMNAGNCFKPTSRLRTKYASCRLIGELGNEWENRFEQLVLNRNFGMDHLKI